MTLLQTRVTEPVAEGFRKAAEERGLTPYALLANLVKLTAGGRRKGGGWKAHAAWLDHRMAAAIRILRSAAVSSRPAAAGGYTEFRENTRSRCGWSGRHSRAPGQKENFCGIFDLA